MKPHTLAQVEIIDAIGTLMAELVCEHSPEAALRAAEIVYATMRESFSADDTAATESLARTRRAIAELLKRDAQGASLGDIAARLILS